MSKRASHPTPIRPPHLPRLSCAKKKIQTLARALLWFHASNRSKQTKRCKHKAFENKLIVIASKGTRRSVLLLLLGAHFLCRRARRCVLSAFFFLPSTPPFLSNPPRACFHKFFFSLHHCLFNGRSGRGNCCVVRADPSARTLTWRKNCKGEVGHVKGLSLFHTAAVLCARVRVCV